MTFNDTPDAHEIRKRLIEDEMIYRREERLGILEAEKGKETVRQLAIAHAEVEEFKVRVGGGVIE